MFTLSVTILAGLGVVAILFRICEAITVESYTISIRDFGDEPPKPPAGAQSTASAARIEGVW
jgi:hypothetical protein